MGEMLSFDCNGDHYRGYLAKSVTGKGPAVVVIQEWWGLVGHITDIADRFAAEGFTALAPDLYKGETAGEPEEAGKMMMALNISETEQILRCAIDTLLENSAVSSEKAGVVGFCMGGQLSLFAAATNKTIGACVDYYGIHPNVTPPLEQLVAPVLGFFADQDGYTTPEVVRNLDAALTKLGKPHEFHTYHAQHAFFNDQRPEVYDSRAAEETWERTIKFFKENLQ